MPDRTAQQLIDQYGTVRPVLKYQSELEPLKALVDSPERTDAEIIRDAGLKPLTIREMHRLSVLSDSPVTEKRIRSILHEAIRKLRKVYQVPQ